MLRLGITGGIGSGKSFVCHLLSIMGIPVYDTDRRARALYTEDIGLKRAMVALLGEDIYDAGGEINRQELGVRIFGDQVLLKQVEALVHPLVRCDIQCWYDQLVMQNCRVCVIESALLLTSPFLRSMVDRSVSVIATREQRLKRTMQRDNCSLTQVEARMMQQLPDEMWRKESDFVIDNTESIPLLPQIHEMFSNFMD